MLTLARTLTIAIAITTALLLSSVAMAGRPDLGNSSYADHNNPRQGVDGSDGDGHVGSSVFRNGNRITWTARLNDSEQEAGGNYGRTWNEWSRSNEGHFDTMPEGHGNDG